MTGLLVYEIRKINYVDWDARSDWDATPIGSSVLVHMYFCTWWQAPLGMMDSGYDSDYGCADFTSPTVQLTAAVSYEDYCRKTGHQKTEPKQRERGKSKGKTTMNCHAKDRAPHQRIL